MRLSKMNRPDYYTGGDYEPVKVIYALGLNFPIANVLKYLNRAGKKTESPVQDLEKAITYLDFQLEMDFPIELNFNGLHGPYSDCRISNEWELPHDLAVAMTNICLAISSRSKGMQRAHLCEAKRYIQKELTAKSSLF